ncbi:MAG TPA: hypothetical protein VGQ11_05805, partial [Candidatus Acidoferrales bacterium]|nr:hypothetical protein [Candidatus Acidoferrales bacterium]
MAAARPVPGDEPAPLGYKPPVVFAVHGIRTNAPWFDTLAGVLQQEGIAFEFHRYGFFRLWRMLLGPNREKALENFVNFYEQQIARYAGKGVDPDDPCMRPSIIAHSFGSYLVGHSLLKYDYLKFDKVILCGSILPRDFPWTRLVARGQVDYVYNDFGGRDVWCGTVGFGIPGKTGPSGRDGFATRSKMVQQHE